MQYISSRKNAKLGDMVLYGGIHPNFVMSNLSVPVKIDGRQQHEETRSLLKPGTNVYRPIATCRTSAGFRVPCLHGKLAKLGGVVSYGYYIHPRTSISNSLVNQPVFPRAHARYGTYNPRL